MIDEALAGSYANIAGGTLNLKANTTIGRDWGAASAILNVKLPTDFRITFSSVKTQWAGHERFKFIESDPTVPLLANTVTPVEPKHGRAVQFSVFGFVSSDLNFEPIEDQPQSLDAARDSVNNVGHTYHYQIEKIADRIQVLRDGALQFDYSGGLPLDFLNYLGIVNLQAGATSMVDDLQIYSIPEPCETVLDFNSPLPGTLNDGSGIGTGFTYRLPGTGAAVPANDPNLDLNSAPGYLSFTSQRSDIGQLNGFGRNLGALDAPGLLLSDMVGKDFKVTAKFDDVQVPGLSDQLLLYVGTSADNVVRAGFHEYYESSEGQYIFAGNTGNGDFGFPAATTGSERFSVGDDIELQLSRIADKWSLEWHNLTNPAASGSYSNISIPWLDAESDLYVGIMHMDARNFTPQTAKIDYFHVAVGACVPEPSRLAFVLVTCVAVIVCRFTPRQPRIPHPAGCRWK